MATATNNATSGVANPMSMLEGEWLMIAATPDAVAARAAKSNANAAPRD